MTTYVNTSASEIFSRFKGPKMDSLFSLSLSLHFTFTINFEESYSRTSLTTINFEESYTPYLRYRRSKKRRSLRDLLFFGLTPLGESPFVQKVAPLGGSPFVQQVAPRKPIRLLTRTKSPCSDDHLREHFRLRNFQPI